MVYTYISLFSSAGVGCYGFKKNGFECIATNEIIQRRLDVQKYNKKCKYETGYICGDITLDATKQQLYDEIKLWNKKEKLKQVDVVIATPPCQGMSVANHKKNETEIIRNSLVIESIKIIKKIHPKFFVFENVPAFMKTVCTDIDGYDKPIADAIFNNLSNDYVYVSKVINFKDYGACSSRSRTLVIGVSKELSDEISPYDLFPSFEKEKTLRQVIGNLKPLTAMGEIDSNDIYHAFRSYPEEMRNWIHDLKEGESAFDNEDITKKPHQVINGKIVINKQKNADKYTRTYWDKVGPCVHTRNDQLASQNTIHPSDDRVFSIRELMQMMTIPKDFKWSNQSLEELNKLSDLEKKQYLKKEEIKIRQSLGEAVPTIIFDKIASNITSALSYNALSNSQIISLVKKLDFKNSDDLLKYIQTNPDNYSMSVLCKIAEYANTKRTEEAAFFTNKELITEMMNRINVIDKDSISILEPSCGVGNFVPLILKKFENKKVQLDLLDIDDDSLKIAKVLLSKYVNSNISIRFIRDDFLVHHFDEKYDYVIGNPPFDKLKSSNKMLNTYKKHAINKDTNNICSFFLDKALEIGDYISFVFPKFLLNTPEFSKTREYLRFKCVESIIDYGEKGFPGVLIETIAIHINNLKKPGNTLVFSATKNIDLNQKQSYIFDAKYPYWIIYRNDAFDKVANKIEFDVFDVFRDRQITNAVLKDKGDIQVIKARNIDDKGENIFSISGYDSYLSSEDAKKLSVYSFINRDDVYLTPNMTYYPRLIKKPLGTIVNGSVAILIPKKQRVITEKQRAYFSSKEYRDFYQIARNYQTRSLNVDACSVFFYGVLKGGE